MSRAEVRCYLFREEFHVWGRRSCPTLVIQTRIIQGKISWGQKFKGQLTLGEFHEGQLSREKLFSCNCPGSKRPGVIVLEGISWGAIVRGSCLVGTIQGKLFGGKSPGGNYPGGNFMGSNCPGGSCPGGECLDTKKIIIGIQSFSSRLYEIIIGFGSRGVFRTQSNKGLRRDFF